MRVKKFDSTLKVLKQLRIDQRIRVGYGVSFLLLLIFYFLTLYANRQLMAETQWINHTYKINSHLEDLVSSVKDAETGIRGYIAIKDKTFLEPYYNSFASIDKTFRKINEEKIEDSLQQNRFNILKNLIHKKYEMLEFAVNNYPKQNYKLNYDLFKASYNGKDLMDSIRQIVNKMQVEQKTLLENRSNKLKSNYYQMNTITIISLILTFFLVMLGWITYIRENKARKIADKKVTEYQNELQHRIQELDTANKELIQMRRIEKFAATGRIARTIAHEVRNPLTNITLATEQLNEVIQQTKDSPLLLDMINRNANRINQLVSELLNSTKFSELQFIKVSVNELLDEALEMAKDRIELHNIKIHKKYTPDICDILVDKEKIKIAFLNIMINAIEAMEANKGILQIQTESKDNKCIIIITDNGTGMNEETLASLFEPYFTRKEKGNGLGLTNTQNIIFNHKGNITVESNLGKGSSFVISLNFS